MTPERAIEILRGYSFYSSNTDYMNDFKTAKRMAIKALEREAAWDEDRRFREEHWGKG